MSLLAASVRHAIACAVLGAAVIAVYGATLDHPFVYDDVGSIVRNRGVHLDADDPSSWARLSFWRPTPRPVANASFALDHARAGLDVRAFRATNLVIHALAALGVYVLSLQLLRGWGRLAGQGGRVPDSNTRWWLALFAGLLFAVHPLQTQAVTYVVQRMTSLAALLYVAALVLWVAGGERASPLPRRALRVAAVGTWLLALGAKEIAITWPAVVALWEWGIARERGRDGLRRYGPGLLLAAAGFAIVVAWWLSSGDPLAGYADKRFTMAERVWTQPRVVWRYWSLVWLPLAGWQSLIHDVSPSTSWTTPWTTLASWLGGLAVLVLLAWSARRWRLVCAMGVWWCLHLIVESSVLPLEMMYEHRTYLPLVGVCAVVPWAWWSATGAGREWGAALVGMLAVLLLGFAASERNEVWSSREALWRDALAKAPGHPRPHVNLGMVISERDHAAALPHYERAIEIDPLFQEGHHNLGVSLEALGRYEEAERALGEALRLQPGDALAHEALASALIGRGELAAAARELEVAIGLGASSRALFTLAQLEARAGRLDEARRRLEMAMPLSTGNPNVPFELGRILVAQGEFAGAAVRLDQSLALWRRPPVLTLRARVAWARGEWEPARSLALEAVDAAPGDADAIATAAWILCASPVERLRDPERAWSLMASASWVNPSPALVEARAAALAGRGRFREAVALVDVLVRGAHEQGWQAAAREFELQRAAYAGRSMLADDAERARARLAIGSWRLLAPEG